MVQLSYHGRTTTAPVWDVGPWNFNDDYWNATREGFPDLPRWTSQSEAAFFLGHNNGRDGYGRFITVPTSIDLADGTYYDDLGLGNSDWIDVTFLWVNAPSPPARLTPAVVAKAPSPQGVGTLGAPSNGRERAASYNAPVPATRVFLPRLAQDAAGWTTSFTLQNTSTVHTAGAIDLSTPLER